MVYDTFTPKAKVILWRQVVNDAVVGPWQELEGVKDHTDAGLRQWMLDEGQNGGEYWDLNNLGPGGWDSHLRNFGMRLQFWVPDPETVAAEVVGEDVVVVCVDTTGLDDLTPGREYVGKTDRDGLYELEDDKGEKRGFFRDRFKRLRAFLCDDNVSMA